MAILTGCNTSTPDVEVEVEFISDLYLTYNSSNYDEYIKPFKDSFGFNKGECNRGYLMYEEYFYNECTDHWNVDRVYDPEYAILLHDSDPN